MTVPPYLHLIGPERYGVLAIVWIFLGYFGLFSMGLDRATANELARCGDDPGRRVTVFWTALFANGLFGTVGAVALGVAAGFMLGPVFKISAAMKPEVFAALPWLVASVPLATVTSVMIGALEARERFVTLNWLSLVGTFLFQLIPLAIAYWHGPDLGWLIASTILSRTLGTLMLLAACVRAVPLPAVRVDWSHVPTLLRYGGWVTVTGLIGPLLTTLDRFVIAATAGPAGVTYYTIPYNLATKALIVPGALTRALFPRFSAQTAADAAELSRKGGDEPLRPHDADRGLRCSLDAAVLDSMGGPRDRRAVLDRRRNPGRRRLVQCLGLRSVLPASGAGAPRHRGEISRSRDLAVHRGVVAWAPFLGRRRRSGSLGPAHGGRHVPVLYCGTVAGRGRSVAGARHGPHRGRGGRKLHPLRLGALCFGCRCGSRRHRCDLVPQCAGLDARRDRADRCSSQPYTTPSRAQQMTTMTAAANAQREMPQYGLETVAACPVCESKDASVLHAGLKDTTFFCAPGSWNLQGCGNCGSAFLSPRLDKASIHVAYEAYYTHAAQQQSLWEGAPKGMIGRVRRRAREGYLATRFLEKATPNRLAHVHIRARSSAP